MKSNNFYIYLCTSIWVVAELRPHWWQAKLQLEVCALMEHTHTHACFHELFITTL